MPEPNLPSTSARLEVRSLTRAFGDVTVVEDVSFSIAPGQVTCLLGPSGCGKSTTLRMIAGVEHPDSGEIRVDGEVICDDALRLPPEQRGVGLMFQDFALFPHLSVAGNVGFGLRGAKAERMARVDELLEKVSLSHLLDAYPHELSGGEQQRVALARALAPKPKVMLMDEPFSGLDNRLRDGIRDETLQVLRDEGTSVLLVTHEPEEAMGTADEIALMRDGALVQKGAPYNIYNAPVDKHAVAFFSDVNVIEGVAKGALVETPFGQFLCPGVPDGGGVEIVFRPQHVKIDFDRQGRGPNPTINDGVAARATVRRARFMGSESLVDFDVDGGLHIRALLPNVFLPKPGTVFWLTVPRNRCHIFKR
ncbi:ABC transporter ATP-binding protein [Pseudaestuariivita sp.]|uniref:ABC transporter ATP-binding protein n=1 Tax=Pseudaestuariivita sp. TaxID=2211669 RepID=UPI004057EF66